MAPIVWLPVVAAAFAGCAAWHGPLWTIPLSLLMPCIAASQPTRLRAFVAAVAYYAAASTPIVTVARAYWPTIGLSALLVWVSAALTLSLPWACCWSGRPSLRPFTSAAALAISAVPPLCIVGWASPIIAAGVLFPGSAWFGLLVTFAVPSLLLHPSTRLITASAGAIMALLLNLGMASAPFPAGWTGETTAFRRQAIQEAVVDFQIEEQLKSLAQSSTSRYIVFPEGSVRVWTDATDLSWSPSLADSGRVVLIGAAQATADSVVYDNSVVIFDGHIRRAILQRIPVPGGMWNPLNSRQRFSLHLFDHGIADVGGQRVAALICYEALLVWPMLRSAVERPTLLIAVANNAWTSNTAVPDIQQACVRAWARLFGLPTISAINS